MIPVAPHPVSPDAAPRVLAVPGGTVELHPCGLTRTRYPGLPPVDARPHDTDDYRQRARELGYGDDTAAMSRDHELTHALVSKALGLPYSPTLRGVVVGEFFRHWREEESAVLALQALARRCGVDLAARLSD